MSYSIFAKRAFVNTSHKQDYDPARKVRHGHLQRVSSIIRADQIAERLPARLNPEQVNGDVCIYVKPHVKHGEPFKFAERAYLDIVDGWRLTPLMHDNPRVPIIACSQSDYAKLKSVMRNPLYLIPQHHCNFERAARVRHHVTVVGCIGEERAFAHLPMGLESELAERGVRLECYSKFFTRHDVADFYQRIDVQIIWRPYRMQLSNPLKIVNAAAFGVPTIAYREDVFRELEGAYIPVNDLGEFLHHLDRLRGSLNLYLELAGNGLLAAEAYHIDNICKLYRELQ